MSERNPKTQFWAGLIGGALGGFVAGRRLAARRAEPGPRLPDEKTLQRRLTLKHGLAKAADLMARIRARYAELSVTRPRYDQRALRQHLDNILQGLAIYLMCGRGDGSRAALRFHQSLARRDGEGQRVLRRRERAHPAGIVSAGGMIGVVEV